jgi:3-oxoacyl-[acyl-carrier protein] reductase
MDSIALGIEIPKAVYAPMEAAADLVEYLLSDKSDGITGKLISAVWDDWPALMNFPDYRDKMAADADMFTLRRHTKWSTPVIEG